MQDEDVHVSIDFDWFASRQHYFPWRELGYDRPKYGPAHSYACDILAKLSRNETERQFLAQRPSLRELARFISSFESEDPRWPAYASKIHEMFRPADANGQPNTRRPDGSVEAQLIRFLSGLSDFRRWAEQRLTLLWREGRFAVPEAALERRRKQVTSGYDW